MQIADLHLHSKYSRATSKNLDLDALVNGAKLKGIDTLGTGDWTHPKWLGELKSKLGGNGIYSYKDVNFVLSTEISLMYKHDGKGRRIHHIILAPNFDVVDQANEWLDTKGRRDYDGRPIFGFTSIELVEQLMSISREIEIIPAHCLTPWMSIFGSMSGFDSLKGCFQEKTKYIHSIETGLSADPSMLWRLSELDKITLLSNSDSHSAHPWRLGREANVFDIKKMSYGDLIKSIRTRKGLEFTVEVEPSYGKYHWDGHRKCNVCQDPKITIKKGKLCPKCKKTLTIGVQYRVEELADRKDGYKPKNAIPFKSMLPLSELIGHVVKQGVATKKVKEVYTKLVMEFGNEFNVLLTAQRKFLEKVVDKKIADIILANREGKIKVKPGYDGVYGEIKR